MFIIVNDEVRAFMASAGTDLGWRRDERVGDVLYPVLTVLAF